MSDELKATRPGHGWWPVGNGVWQHASGWRITPLGMCRTEDGRILTGMHWPESKEVDRCVAINGGNRKRGVMAWAMQLRRAEIIASTALGIEVAK